MTLVRIQVVTEQLLPLKVLYLLCHFKAGGQQIETHQEKVKHRQQEEGKYEYTQPFLARMAATGRVDLTPRDIFHRTMLVVAGCFWSLERVKVLFSDWGGFAFRLTDNDASRRRTAIQVPNATAGTSRTSIEAAARIVFFGFAAAAAVGRFLVVRVRWRVILGRFANFCHHIDCWSGGMALRGWIVVVLVPRCPRHGNLGCGGRGCILPSCRNEFGGVFFSF